MRQANRRAITPHRCVEVWRLYAEFRRGQIAPSTFVRDYRKLDHRLVRMAEEAPHLKTAIEIRDWLLEHYAPETARRTLVQLNACFKWAWESMKTKTNPFTGLQTHIRPSPPGDRAWCNFELDERNLIIREFEDRAPRYAPWVKFLFWTGCRPEEARALRWNRHIAGDCSEILFSEAYPMDAEAPQAIKNYKVTRFPCNPRLTRLLKVLRPDELDAWVFPNELDGPFEYHNFQNRQWKPIVEGLVKKGAIAFYLPQVHCRHTWITAAVDHPQLSIKHVAYLARVSPKVLYDHYAGRTRKPLVPEF